jgi:hypothetical protein
MRDVPLLVAGSIIGAVGTAGLVGGIVAIKVDQDRASMCTTPGCGFGISGLGDIGYGLMALLGGLAFVAGGVMAGVGASPVPVHGLVDDASIVVGPRFTGVRLRF